MEKNKDDVMYGKKVTKATLMKLEEAMNSIVICWRETCLEDNESYIEPVSLCFGKLVDRSGNCIDLAVIPDIYNNRRKGFRLWVGPKPTEKKRTATPWET